jgi:RsiW-degrading membrane proteinase PrsW (M82 family)
VNILILIAAALLPAILLLLYIWKKDPQKEPTSQLVKAVLYGVAICIPVAILEGGIDAWLFGPGDASSIIDTTIQAFFVAALPEEACKLLVLWLVLRKNPYFDEHFDGIVYAVCVGLGFAAIENVFYVLGEGEDWMSVAVTRALLAVPGHYAFAILMGYYYSVYHFVDNSSKIAACVLLVPVLAHGIYDALALSGTVNPFVGVLGFFVLIYFCIRMHKFANRKVIALIKKDVENQVA